MKVPRFFQTFNQVMKILHKMLTLLLFLMACNNALFAQQAINSLLPVETKNRQDWETVQLTPIGQFGVLRKARSNVPAHLHTGIDLKRPTPNYTDEYIFPFLAGEVISLREDGPYAQIIIEHPIENQTPIWSVYEHVAEIYVAIGDTVNQHDPIARFMNKHELNQYGWQFDHLHFEILKHKPRSIKPKPTTPFRLFGTYSLACYNKAALDKHYHNPRKYLEYQSLKKNK